MDTTRLWKHVAVRDIAPDTAKLTFGENEMAVELKSKMVV